MKDLLLNPKISLWRYCPFAFVLVTVPSLALFKMAYFGFRLTGLDPAQFSPPDHGISFWGVIGTVVFAPVAETLLLALFLTILSSFIISKLRVAVVSGVLWGLLHGLFGLLWFFAPAWGFFILSCAYLAWHEKGFKYAFIAALIPHMLQNTVSVLLTIFF